MDKMIWQGKQYDLAKNTMNMARLIETAEESRTMIEAYDNQMNVVIAALGGEVAEDVLETVDIEEVDLGTLVLVYTAVIDGYEKRIVDMRMSKDEKTFNSPVIKGVGKLANDVKVLKSAGEMKK